ncbi:MAG: gamma-glutamyltransferase [Acidobacteria bacterium RIFCSPLOWO2_02_FULL_67_21]|nr:MAG: gamma-glutamyltransferase [Acidobacteria bacterium RIFCSPLOWO2_02_FULL_67_21]
MARALTDYARTLIERRQARSMVISPAGVVASENPLASQAGAMMLARGGHAVDAAIATNAAMGVVAPMMNGVGGDLFAIVYDAGTDSVRGINASGWAPSALTVDRLKASGCDAMPQTGIHAVTIPGAVAGWGLLHERFGRLSLAQNLEAAIHLAEEGFPVSELTAEEWAGSEATLRADAHASRIYLPSGAAPRVGQRFRNPDLAWTYRQLAANGPDALYRGSIADRILACSKLHGGTLSAADLAEFTAEWVTPIATTYHDWTVHEIPPNGQGIAALMMLNLLEGVRLKAYGHNSADALHALIEVKKLAYADLSTYIADPRFAAVPTEGLLSKAYATERLTRVNHARASDDPPPGHLPVKGGDTTYLCVADRHGNMVSLIQSNFASFGSGLVPDGTGFALQNRGGLFTLDPAHPNVVMPRKRPLHTIIPGFMSRAGVRIAFGIMGGWNQAQAHAQFVSNIVDHGMNIQAALEAARFTKLTFGGRDVSMECRVPGAVRAELTRRGHDIEELGEFSSLVGGGQSVLYDADARVAYGASDPRKDGAAIPEPLLG